MKSLPTCLLILLAGALHAQTDEVDADKQRKGDNHSPRWHAEFIQKGDKNQDGVLSLEEFSAMERVSKLPADKQKKLFDRLDKNKDGQIMARELAEMKKPHGKRPDLRIRQMDENRDGSVTFDEFLKSPFVQKLPEARRRAFFNRLDANDDGELSVEDHRHRMAERERRHGDGGGRSNGDSRRPNPERIMNQFDEDKDGSLSFAEFRKLPWIADKGEDAQEDHFERLDKDGDHKVTAEEFTGPRDKRDR